MQGKVLVVSDGGSNRSYYTPFTDFGDDVYDCELLWENPRSINLIVFTGGADVAPNLYGQMASKGTGQYPKRDIFESIVFRKALSMRMPMVGICRGAQFLNVMAGGKLVQHLDGHTAYHDMTTIDGKTFLVSSTHHQMILPPDGAELLGWATDKRSKVYYGEKDQPIKPVPQYETEAVHWPNIRAAGMQYHPEMMDANTDGFKYAAYIVKKYLFKMDC